MYETYQERIQHHQKLFVNESMLRIDKILVFALVNNIQNENLQMIGKFQDNFCNLEILDKQVAWLRDHFPKLFG